MTTTLFYIYDSVDQTGTTPVPEAQVRLYSEDGTVFVTTGDTDENGELVLDVPDATYWVRFFKTGYSFPSKRFVIVDAGAVTNEFDIEAGNLEQLPPSTADNLCRVSGYAVDAAGQPRRAATYQFMLPAWRHIVGNRAITAAKVIAQTDEYGYLEVELIQGAFYEVVVEGMDDQVFVCQVPESQAANVTEVVWPYPARIESESASLALTAGDEETVELSLVLSSGVVLPYPTDAPPGAPHFDLKATSSDTDVVTVAYSLRTQTLTVNAVAAGSATISFTASGDYEDRLPALELSFDEISVSVV